MAESALATSTTPGIEVQAQASITVAPKLLVIGGVMRGGTTLLRSILDSHPAIDLFLSELRALTWCGKPMLSHVVRVHHHLLLASRWRHYPRFRWQVYRYLWQLVRENGLLTKEVTIDMCHRAFIACLAHPESRYVGDKYPDYVFRAASFANRPDCRTLLIIRDPRDVVASILYRIRHGDWAGQGWAQKYASVEAACRYWNDAARAIGEFRNSTAGVLVIRYEDLVMERLATESRIAGFLELNPDGFEGNHAHVESVGKHAFHLGAEELRTIERLTAAQMPAFGYTWRGSE